LNLLYLDLVGFRFLGRARHSCGGNHDLGIDFAGNVVTGIKPSEQIETADLGQRDQRGGIGNDNHTPSRSIDRRSSARSALP
jgi:hypothetical protein